MVCSVGVGTVAEYYLHEQSEYYTGGKEPTGRWYQPSGAFGLNDGVAVDATAFRNLHNGLAPDGESLEAVIRSSFSKRVGGYDLTFSSPKSVSVLWAVADEDVRAAIESAQEEAARFALGVLNERASFARRGKGGAVLEKVQLTGALFQHGESRPTERADGTVAADPQLHTHAVVFNLAERSDGTWGALDGRHFFKWKMAAGALYRAHLAHALRSHLGVAIEVGANGLFEVAGLPEQMRAHFSARRHSIEQELAELGLRTQDAQALASTVTKSSRLTKATIDEKTEERHARWQHEANALGLDRQAIAACFNRPEGQNVMAAFEEGVRDIPRILTEHDATFRLESLYRAAAEAALAHGADGDDVGRAVADLLVRGEVIEIGADEAGLPVYSTQEMIQIETDLATIARQGARSKWHRISDAWVDMRVRDAALTEEQRAAVTFVTQGSDVTVIEGAAGAGKTYALRSVADVYQTQGYRVIGTSTAWRMAHQLGNDLSIESRATDSWLARENEGKPFLDHNTVLIVDEAGQLSSRQMLSLLEAAQRDHAKVILTGDQRQLQAIGAGPGLRLVAEQTGSARIDTIVRQREAWARRAVENLSVGRADEAIKAFEDHNALEWCRDGAEATTKAVADWQTFKSANPDKTAMVLANTNRRVQSLNKEMRSHLRNVGRLIGKDHTVKAIDPFGRGFELPVAVGDQVLFKTRNDLLGVVNGTTGRVTHIQEAEGDVHITVDIAGREVSVSSRDHADGKGRLPLAHGYATTVYSAQGATVDAAFIIADPALKRNEVYVAASRARGESRLYVDKDELEKSIRARMPLTDPDREKVPRHRLRAHLAEKWSRAQIKSSTQDFRKAVGPTMAWMSEKSAKASPSSMSKFVIPTILVGR